MIRHWAKIVEIHFDPFLAQCTAVVVNNKLFVHQKQSVWTPKARQTVYSVNQAQTVNLLQLHQSEYYCNPGCLSTTKKLQNKRRIY